ncbi:Metallo-dependent hydrolase [Cylindrobasidium torrendii FP15055 ss-10]|uniref:Metallo-dependent hydrolase n=1 Tax=Cylindrobasidium torrendii FP15055 ss-10 TaxID=1314674 RepID=A0A0D7BPM6_9AGAR|nr:Metallo-dependent hydrolase [Cylindrobasidium torrendii FP15055 ss-10]
MPSLCHSHIHLDKCFIYDRCNCINGDFPEALKLTAEAKQQFPQNQGDLIQRGRRLIHESIECGVTAMRVHVEVDEFVKFSCLEAALSLKAEFRSACHVQISVFAQEPLFSTANDDAPGSNFALLETALRKYGNIESVGSAPYVEPTITQAKMNIRLVLELAVRHDLHLDFHLDYNLDPASEPLIFEVVSRVQEVHRQPTSEHWRKHVTIGHATRLQLFTPEEWHKLIMRIGDLHITLVGLPNSDLYMQGRADAHKPLGAPRATLRVPQLVRQHGLQVAMSVNNVGNAFTPQGSVDPLALCTLGVAIFQAATPEDIHALACSVTSASKRAMGLNAPGRMSIEAGDTADLLVMHHSRSLADVVLNPSYDRTTIRGGVVVSSRHTVSRLSAPRNDRRSIAYVGVLLLVGLWWLRKECI